MLNIEFGPIGLAVEQYLIKNYPFPEFYFHVSQEVSGVSDCSSRIVEDNDRVPWDFVEGRKKETCPPDELVQVEMYSMQKVKDHSDPKKLQHCLGFVAGR